MPRYIDADELYDILSLFYDTEIVRKDKVARFIAEQTLFDIKEIPTADVQEVVHCGLCKNRVYRGGSGYCPVMGIVQNEYWRNNAILSHIQSHYGTLNFRV